MRRLVNHSLVYGLGSALSAAGGFILLPLYTHVLDTAEYGVLELLNRIGDVMILVFFLGCRQAYLRLYYDQPDEPGRQVLTGTMILFSLAISLSAVAVVLPVLGIVDQQLLGSAVPRNALYLALLWVPLEMVVNIGLSFLQARMRPALFVMVGFLRLVGYVGLNAWFLYVLGWSITGVFAAQTIITGAVACAFLVYFVQWSRLRASVDVLRQLLKLGLPYLPTTLFMYVIANADRLFLTASTSLSAVGLYALSFKLGISLTMLFLEPILRAWWPFLYAHYQDADGPLMLGRAVTLFALAAVAVALTIAVSAPLVIPLIAGEQYYDAWRYVPPLCVAGVFYGLQHVADAGILIGKKTSHKPFIFGAAAVVSVVGNALLVPRLGINGAALTAIGAYGVLLYLTHSYAVRYYRMTLERGRLALIVCGAVLAYLLSLVPGYLGPQGRLGMLLSLGAIPAFPLILWVAGFFTPEERRMLSGFARLPWAIRRN
jgi:O-antigen/teichoic acid export membrane protein